MPHTQPAESWVRSCFIPQLQTPCSQTHTHLPALRFSPLLSATSLSTGKCHLLLLWLEDHWWQLVDIKLSLCPWWLVAIQGCVGRGQWLSLCLTSHLINANFSFDHRAIIPLTNYLLVMEPGVVFTLHHFVTSTFVVTEGSCGRIEPWSSFCPVIYYLSGLNLRENLL